MEELIEFTANKSPIEIALRIDSDGMTTARKLYEWLELNPAHYARWLKDSITENPYADESDFSPLVVKNKPERGRPTEDYRITASLAKRISMASKSERGEQARQYFIGCEQILKRLAEEKQKTAIERAKGIGIRIALTDVIKASGENERMHGHAFSLYTDLIYRALFGKTSKQLREFFNISKKQNLRDYLNASEIAAVAKYEDLAKSLMNAGWGYSEIKKFLVSFENRFEIENKRSEQGAFSIPEKE